MLAALDEKLYPQVYTTVVWQGNSQSYEPYVFPFLTHYDASTPQASSSDYLQGKMLQHDRFWLDNCLSSWRGTKNFQNSFVPTILLVTGIIYLDICIVTTKAHLPIRQLNGWVKSISRIVEMIEIRHMSLKCERLHKIPSEACWIWEKWGASPVTAEGSVSPARDYSSLCYLPMKTAC
jgi:hypothetical protein